MAQLSEHCPTMTSTSGVWLPYNAISQTANLILLSAGDRHTLLPASKRKAEKELVCKVLQESCLQNSKTLLFQGTVETTGSNPFQSWRNWGSKTNTKTCLPWVQTRRSLHQNLTSCSTLFPLNQWSASKSSKELSWESPTQRLSNKEWGAEMFWKSAPRDSARLSWLRTISLHYNVPPFLTIPFFYNHPIVDLMCYWNPITKLSGCPSLTGGIKTPPSFPRSVMVRAQPHPPMRSTHCSWLIFTLWPDTDENQTFPPAMLQKRVCFSLPFTFFTSNTTAWFNPQLFQKRQKSDL